jgi:TonB family protein
VNHSPVFGVCTAAFALAALTGCAHPAKNELSHGTLERPAILAENQPKPVYPAELLAERVSGRVQIRVTVLPNGRADSSTLVILASSHELFTNAVEALLPKLKFWPAEVGGTEGKSCHPNPPYPPSCDPGKPGHKVAQQLDLTFAFVPPTT